MTIEVVVLDRPFLRARAYRIAGEIHDCRGARPAALEVYGRFVELWQDGDRVARKQVKRFASRLTRCARGEWREDFL